MQLVIKIWIFMFLFKEAKLLFTKLIYTRNWVKKYNIKICKARAYHSNLHFTFSVQMKSQRDGQSKIGT